MSRSPDEILEEYHSERRTEDSLVRHMGYLVERHLEGLEEVARYHAERAKDDTHWRLSHKIGFFLHDLQHSLQGLKPVRQRTERLRQELREARRKARETAAESA
jgi:hypothetical protein